MVKTCTCKHDDQDKMYGAKQRVHTPTNKGHRCTVCGNVSGEVAKKK
jgi:hypothetical protein